MDEIRAALDLNRPSSVSPDSTEEFSLQYANRNEDALHRLETITLSPTWDLSQDYTHEVDHAIPAQTKQKVLTTSIETPLGLGGRHGVHVSFEVEIVTEDGGSYSDKRRTVNPWTVPVTEAQHFEAVVCTAGGRELPSPVRQIIQNWGFDIYLADDVQAATDRFTESGDSPTLFVGVVPIEGTDEDGMQLVTSAAWAAADQTTLSIILADEDVNLPEFPPETAVFSCQITDPRELLRVIGPELLALRRALETEQTSILITLLQRGRTMAKQEPKEVLRNLVYGTLLAAVGADPQNVLESIEVPDKLFDETPQTRTYPASPWPMRGANPANTRHQPQESGPINNVTTHWTVETGGEVSSSPAVADGTVYVGGLDGNVYALDANTGRTRWTVKTGGEVSSSPAVADGTVYVGGLDGNMYALYALDANTGRTRWTLEGRRFSSPAVADGTVYVGGRDGNLYALDANTGRTRWTLEGRQSRSLAVADGTVYVGSNDNHKVYALDTDTGRKDWIFEGKINVSTTPWTMFADGTVYAMRRNGIVHALDANTGQAYWTDSIREVITSSPAVADGTLYVGSHDGIVYALDANTGRTRWTVETGGAVYSSPAVADGTVYVGSLDNNVYALDANTGQARWTVETGGEVRSSPAVADGTVYIGSNDHNVYALTES